MRFFACKCTVFWGERAKQQSDKEYGMYSDSGLDLDTPGRPWSALIEVAVYVVSTAEAWVFGRGKARVPAELELELGVRGPRPLQRGLPTGEHLYGEATNGDCGGKRYSFRR